MTRTDGPDALEFALYLLFLGALLVGAFAGIVVAHFAGMGMCR